MSSILRAVRISAIVLAAVLYVGAGAHADAKTAARKAIQAAFDRDAVAIGKLDVSEVFENCAPDCVVVQMDGRKLHFSDMRQSLEALVRSVRSLRYRAAITKFALKDRTATLTVTERLTAVGPDSTGNVKSVTMESVSDETWTLRGKRWLRKLSTARSEKTIAPKSGAASSSKRSAAPNSPKTSPPAEAHP